MLTIPAAIKEAAGRDAFPPMRRSSPPLDRLVAALIGLFLIAVFLADLYPCKNVDSNYAYVERGNVLALDMNFNLQPSMRYSSGFTARYYDSLFYVALIKLFHLIIPYRLLCLRIISVLATSLSLFLLYRIAVILFCRGVGVVLLFILATSPAYLENMRAFGYTPLTNTMVCLICYLLAASLNGRKAAIKSFLMALVSYSLLSLYVIGRLIIFLPVFVFLSRVKKYWKQVVWFPALLVLIVLAIDLLLGAPHFSVKRSVLIHSEWLAPISERAPIDGPVLQARLRFNLQWALKYLSLRYTPIFDKEENVWVNPEPLIRVFFAPFFVLGILVCLWRRRTSNIFLLTWLLLLLGAPLFSSWLPVRRFALALTPVYFMIALGLWFSFRLLTLMIPGPLCRRICILLLLLAGGCNLCLFFSTTAKPEYNYSRRQLRLLAEAVSEKGKPARTVRWNRTSESLIWGNPYFDPKCIDTGVVSRMEFEAVEGSELGKQKRRPIRLKEQVQYALKEGGDILYIHVFSPGCSEKTGGDEQWPSSDIREVREGMGGKAVFSRVDDIDEVLFLRVSK